MIYKPYLDACVYIAAIKGPGSNEPAGNPEMAIQILTAAQTGAFTIHASVFLATEVIRAGKGKPPLDPAMDAKVDQYIQGGGIEWVELDLPLALKARQMARDHGLKPGDAIHLATAVHVGCDRLLTWNTNDFPPGKTVDGVTFAEPYLDGQQSMPVP